MLTQVKCIACEATGSYTLLYLFIICISVSSGGAEYGSTPSVGSQCLFVGIVSDAVFSCKCVTIADMLQPLEWVASTKCM